jgi:hypothetical protein
MPDTISKSLFHHSPPLSTEAAKQSPVSLQRLRSTPPVSITEVAKHSPVSITEVALQPLLIADAIASAINYLTFSNLRKDYYIISLI